MNTDNAYEDARKNLIAASGRLSQQRLQGAKENFEGFLVNDDLREKEKDLLEKADTQSKFLNLRDRMCIVHYIHIEIF